MRLQSVVIQFLCCTTNLFTAQCKDVQYSCIYLNALFLDSVQSPGLLAELMPHLGFLSSNGNWNTTETQGFNKSIAHSQHTAPVTSRANRDEGGGTVLSGAEERDVQY